MNSLIYDDMVPSWNSEKPKYMAFFRMILQMVDDLRVFLESFLRHFDLDTAVGKQLDIIGALLGVSRTLPINLVASERILNDDDYRMYIRARIAANIWNGSNENAIDLYNAVFPGMGLELRDRQDCTMSVVIGGEATTLQIEMLQHDILIPHPAGVKITYEIPRAIPVTTTDILTGVYQAGRTGILSAAGQTGG